MTSDRILELAKECGFARENDWLIPSSPLERFYQLAYQDGQRAMRERAESVSVMQELSEGVACCSDRIRNLEITNE